jgi:plasmid stability protein
MREASKLAGNVVLFVELPRKLKRALKVRAALSDRSMSGQARIILAAALADPADEADPGEVVGA